MVCADMRFLADSMLGKLAKWLRVMGFDTHYQTNYTQGEIETLIYQGYLLLTRHKRKKSHFPDSFFIQSDKIKGQLQELKNRGLIPSPMSKWFTRCLTCNIPIYEVPVEDARDNIPEYVFYQNITGIRFCPSCMRYYWPGSHKTRMIRQLQEWGIEGN